jgi:hypothetical protein
MEIAITALVGLGALVSAVGGVMLLIAAFRVSVLWGLAVIFVPLAQLVFVITHWREAKKAFLVQVLGCALIPAAFGVALAQGVRASGAMTKVLPGFLSAMLNPSGQGTGEAGPPAGGRPSGAPEERQPVEAPPAPGSEYVGKTIQEAIDKLGPPKARLVSEGKTVLFYNNLELTSADGVTIAQQAVRTPLPPRPPPAKPGKKAPPPPPAKKKKR